ncbi:MAG: sugar phosphate isomerase/epimerase family protein [Planctomycetaceae bacterium]
MSESRRQFMARSLVAGGATALLGTWRHAVAAEPAQPDTMQLGLVTYNWGQNWDLPTLIANCAAAGFAGVELRSTHKHGVEPTLTAEQRKDVRQQFADSPVALAGLGSACEYHAVDPAVVRRNIDETKAFIRLCHDCGGTGVKVRPNGLPKEVPVEQTLTQIGKALREVAEFGADFGVAVRLEVHGRGTDELPHIKTIMDAADHPNAVVCWNCNGTDLTGAGLEANFNLVKDRLGTIHLHDLRKDNYPWATLFTLLKGCGFVGWTLLEEGSTPSDTVGAMHEVRRRWEQLLAR